MWPTEQVEFETPGLKHHFNCLLLAFSEDLAANLEDVELDRDGGGDGEVDLEFYDNSHLIFNKHEGMLSILSV